MKRTAHRRLTAKALSPLIGIAAALAIGGPTGLAIGIAAWWISRRLLRADPDRAERLAASRLAPHWPWTLDLIAAGMRAGAPFPQAASAVANAERGPMGERLARFAQAVHLGATAVEAAPELGRLPGADRLARQLDRSSS
ncbi:type II secretion system F family protein, partial [Glycomyces tenuis]